MERYTRVFTLPDILYTEGSPILIVAGAILKDNQTQRILEQLKFQNIQEKRIKALKVQLIPFDTVGGALGDTVEYQYLDLLESRDEEFGQKIPIPLLDGTTRSFTAQVVSVAFEDNSVWESTGEWVSIPEQERLSLVLDGELTEQYRRDFGADKVFVPKKVSDLWFCGCGAVNHPEEGLCHRCQKSFAELETGLNEEVLRKDCAYYKAVTLSRQSDVESVKSAAVQFKELNGWRDSEERGLWCQRKIPEMISEEENRKNQVAKEERRKRKVIVVISIVVAAIVVMIIAGLSIKQNTFTEDDEIAYKLLSMIAKEKKLDFIEIYSGSIVDTSQGKELHCHLRFNSPENNYDMNACITENGEISGEIPDYSYFNETALNVDLINKRLGSLLTN